nr:PREDICTED: DTW domain-containing protein 2 [Latimeria chalumnae]|eukprot:XP_006009646.1 PREDICTED: DTW domain-containing protein 2 [Latimeria chalumnae]
MEKERAEAGQPAGSSASSGTDFGDGNLVACCPPEEEEEGDTFEKLAELPVERSERRPTCSRCSRPEKVCLCPFLPVNPLNVSTCLYIVQHPAEENRVLRTVPLLAACLPEDKCKVLIGRRFSEDRYPELAAVCRSPQTLILYPGAEAANLEELTLDHSDSPYNVVIIDGTWSQAKDMFYRNSIFRLPKQLSRGKG